MKILALFILTFIASCGFLEPVDVVIEKDKIILSEKTTEIKCDPPLKRIRNEGSILVFIEEKWSTFFPWKQIKLADGTVVDLDVTLIDNNGRSYSPLILGRADKALNLRFDPQIPKEASIISINLSSNSNITLNKIVWHNFNPF